MKTEQRKPLKTPKLSIRELLFIKELAAGKSQPQAALIATGSKSYSGAAVNANRMLKKVNVQEALAQALESHGITLNAAIAPIGKALTATKVQITGSGDSAMAEIVEDVDLQLKGSDRALKLMGIGKDDAGTTNNFVFIAGDQRAKYDI